MSNFTEGIAAKTSRLNRADILAAALQLLDEVGLPDLSMRRLAGKLDMQPSGLYWHYANKQTLLAKMSDHIVDHILPAETLASDGNSTDWQNRSLSAACALRDSLLAFRDGAEVVSSTLALGLGAGAALERIRQPLIDAGFAIDIAQVAAESIMFLVLGQVWHQQQRMAAESLGVTAPEVQTTAEAISDGPAIDPLEAGISLILDGLKQSQRV